MMGWSAGSGWSTGAWMGMGIGMVVFWSVIILAVVALVSGGTRRGSRRPPVMPGRPSGTAMEYLDERFARGEISQAEYLTARDALLGR